VYLNGEKIGYDTYTTYSHGEFDVSNVLKYDGTNTLVVRVGTWFTSIFPSVRYVAHLQLREASSGTVTHEKATDFGFRWAETRGSDAYANGERFFAHSGNVVFTRALVGWEKAYFNPAWIRKTLQTLKQEYGYDYLRNHVGHMPSFWYEIADSLGIYFQTEWAFMHARNPEGKARRQTEIAFRRWVHQNVNHPSIFGWDHENEGDAEFPELIAELKRYDPTRPWMETDFYAPHPYGYLGDTIDVERPEDRPGTVLESVDLALDQKGSPDEGVMGIPMWELQYFTIEDANRLLADLPADVGTCYRSNCWEMWAPFPVLGGYGENWTYFLGDITDSLHAQPNMDVIRSLNEPFGLSLRMFNAAEWYREKRVYSPQKTYQKALSVWNDEPQEQQGTVRCWVTDLDGGEVFFEGDALQVTVPGGGVVTRTVSFEMPGESGIYHLRCDLQRGNELVAVSPRRRVMVSREAPEALAGRMAFGGRVEPVPGSNHFTELLTGSPFPEPVRKAIAEHLKGQIISGAERVTEEGRTLYVVSMNKGEY